MRRRRIQASQAVKYRPEIDGLRAVAILPVVFYHAGLAGFSGGFVGVDVFFVISGYLITSIILAERRAGRFSLTQFYVRRIRRIFPALILVTAVSYPVAWALLGPAAMEEFSGSVAASTLFLANVFFLDVTGYFQTAAELKPLLHTWSLAVEEQYYLVFPAAVLLSWRLGSRGQAVLFGGIAVLSLGLAEWHIGRGDAPRAFFMLDTRAWELGVGVLAAYGLSSPRGQALRDAGHPRHAALLGLGLIAIAVVAYDNDTAFPGLAALLPCLGTVLVIAFAAPQNLAGRVLAWPPMVFVGLLSYSLYLWHVPVLTFTRIGTGRDDVWLMLAVCLVAFGLAWLGWRYVEAPLRRMRDAGAPRVFGAAALSMVLLGGLGLAGVQTAGYRASYLKTRVDAATRANFEKYHPQTERNPIADQPCRFRDEVLSEAFVAGFETCARRLGQAVFVLGDSHGRNVFRAIHGTKAMPFLVGLTRGGCQPFETEPKCSYDAVIPFLQEHRAAIARVVFHVSGSHFILDERGEADSEAAFTAGNAARIATERIRKTADYLARLPEGLDIVWLGPFAEARVDLENPHNYSPERLRFNPVSLDLFARLDAMLQAKAKDHPRFRYVSLLDRLAFDTQTLVQDGCMTFSDVDHLSNCGERLFGPAIVRALAP